MSFYVCRALLQVSGHTFQLLDVATRSGHGHIVAFLTNPPSRLDASCASAVACKPSSSDKRECANCGVSNSDRSDLLLKACSRCKLVFYCSKPCQQLHWKSGQHKLFCVAVDDRKTIKVKEDAVKMPEARPTQVSPPGCDVASNKECAVCLEPLSKSITRSLPCGHVFHRDCMADVQSFGLSKKCPLCRSELSATSDVK